MQIEKIFNKNSPEYKLLFKIAIKKKKKHRRRNFTNV